VRGAFPILYCNARAGRCRRTADGPDETLEPLFEEIVRSVAPPVFDPEMPRSAFARFPVPLRVAWAPEMRFHKPASARVFRIAFPPWGARDNKIDHRQCGASQRPRRKTMADNYTIYLVNRSTEAQIFWCFLQEPVGLAGQSGVFANSAASVSVIPDYEGENYFTIPAQYVVGAGASNNAVGLDVKVTSAITRNANLTNNFSAEYKEAPPNQGPSLTLTDKKAGDNEIWIAANAFNRASNENQGWFSNMSFGVNTATGFMGMTWSPSPSTTRKLIPILNFYVAVGEYGANTLAEYTTVSNDSAQLTQRSFERLAATVTYTAKGGWEITKGKPKPSLLARSATTIGSLVDAHRYMTRAHSDLIRLGGESAVQSGNLLAEPAKEQKVTVKTVKWADRSDMRGDEVAAPTLTFLTGALTVTTALAAAFTYFVLSGVEFNITSGPAGGTTIDFTYSGEQSAAAIQNLLKAGADILLRR
jgi:hypothetical protein